MSIQLAITFPKQYWDNLYAVLLSVIGPAIAAWSIPAIAGYINSRSPRLSFEQFLTDKLAISLSNLATSATCIYKNDFYDFTFTCDDPEREAGSKLCIFHDINYLKNENYEKHKEEVAMRFEEKISEYVMKDMPLKFIGYCLPDISFQSKRFTEAVYFNDATFYGVANFGGAKFSNEADFTGAKFSNEADFTGAKFSGVAHFFSATFSGVTHFSGATFSGEAYFGGFGGTIFSNEADFTGAKFSNEANFTGAKFSKVDFRKATFSGEAYFGGAKFSNEAHFSGATFLSEAYFSGEFNGPTYFNYTIFKEPTHIKFEANMSKVSFSDCDITRIRFSDKVTWGGNDGYTIIEEEMLENFLKYSFDWENITTTDEHISRLKDFLRLRGVNWKGDLQFTKIDDEILVKSTSNSLSVDDESSGATKQIDDKESYVFAKNQKKFSSVHIKLHRSAYDMFLEEDKDKLKIYPIEEVSLESVMAVYRNLRENYEYRLRYDEAGKFFTKEMELKRKYRNVHSKTSNGFEIKENCWFRRNLSLTGLYYRFSNYGESIAKPAIIGAVTIGLSALFWHIQNNPIAEPYIIPMSKTVSNFINVTQIWNNTHLLKAFERSVVDFDPILSPGSDIKVGIIDYVVKIVGGGLTFGLLIIALRRKFERKYTR